MSTSAQDDRPGTTGAARPFRITVDGGPAGDAQTSAPATPRNPLAAQPIASLALVLGYVAGSDAARSTPGRLSAIADELERRGVYRSTLAALDVDLGRRVDLLVVADRGQRWAATGRR